jgi:hypothetical protein
MSNLTLKQLEKRVSFGFAGYGHQRIVITYRGKEYKCTSTNTSATDRIGSDNGNYSGGVYKTEKQAYLSLYNECKRSNHLR